MKAILKRIIFILLVFIDPLFSGAQHNWPLTPLSYTPFQWGARDQYFLAKTKHTEKDQRLVLFNHIDNNASVPIGREGVPTSAYRPFMYSKAISVLRTTPNGSFDWLRISGAATCYARDFATDPTDSILVLADVNGNTWDSAYHFPLLTNYTDSTQLLIFKMDTTGKIAWYKFYGGSSAEYAKSITRTKDGNFLVLASTQSNDGDVTNYQGGKDIWLLKINGTNGNIIWKKTYGSALNEIPHDMEVLADESILVAGSADASAFFPSAYTNANAFLMKLDKDGNVIWKRTFGGNNDEEIRNFIPVNDGGFACVGTTNSNSGDMPPGFGGTDVFVSKLKSDGSLQWIKMYGNTDNDVAGDIVYSSCDSSIFASYTKQYNNDFHWPGYPDFIQYVGVEVGIRNNGNQFHYHENNNPYPINPSLTNDGFTYSMAPNTRGGFLGASISHNEWSSSEVVYGHKYTRSFDFIEYGVPLNKQNYDTTICSGSVVFGHTFYSDSTFADTLRNSCLIDTLISSYKVHVISAADSLINKDSLVCYGQLYEGVPVYATFYDRDTTLVPTTCGNRRIINNTHVIVSDLFLTVNRVVQGAIGQSIPLTPQTNGTITWQPNSTLSCLQCQSTVATPQQTTTYYLVSKKANCTLLDSVKIVLSSYYFYVPNAFTPSGYNSTFNALAVGISDYDMQIFNRWGQLIYRTNSLSGGWDGSFKGKAQPIGSYVYMISYRDLSGTKQLAKGNFILIR